MPGKSIHVVFPLFDGLAALDFVAPHAAFSVVPGARITVASVGGRNIDANGLVFSKLADLSKVEGCDVICIPGGFGTPPNIEPQSAPARSSWAQPGCYAASAPPPIGRRATRCKSLALSSRRAASSAMATSSRAVVSPPAWISPWQPSPKSSVSLSPKTRNSCWNTHRRRHSKQSIQMRRPPRPLSDYLGSCMTAWPLTGLQPNRLSVACKRHEKRRTSLADQPLWQATIHPVRNGFAEITFRLKSPCPGSTKSNGQRLPMRAPH
jgi:hypothetical protein